MNFEALAQQITSKDNQVLRNDNKPVTNRARKEGDKTLISWLTQLKLGKEVIEEVRIKK